MHDVILANFESCGFVDQFRCKFSADCTVHAL